MIKRVKRGVSSYDYEKYWKKRGVNYINEDFTSELFRRQESQIIKSLKGIQFNSVLEFGCGFGRITKTIMNNFKPKRYVAFDVSPDQISNAQKLCKGVEFQQTTISKFDSDERFDLVVAVEVLMHNKDAQGILEKMFNFSNKYVLNVNPQRYDGILASHCFNHDYKQIYLNLSKGCFINSVNVGTQEVHLITKGDTL